MKSFTQKKEELIKLKDKLAKAKILIFTSFAREGEKGLKVDDMRALKAGLKAADSEYLVNKKTILDRALTQSPINVFEYPGSLGVTFGYGDEQLAAKTIYNFAKKNPALKYFGAIWNGKLLDLMQFTEFARLPSKEIMIARLLGMMRYPLQALAIVLKQVSDKR